MKYFAYGSNMLEERLQAPNRVPTAKFLSIASVRRYKLQFHKNSDDQSGKCNIVRTNSEEDVVYGVVFKIPHDQLDALDRAEGVGHGYHHDNISIRLADNTETMLTYVADSNRIDNTLSPYEWYHKLVVAGAEQHHLPEHHIKELRAVPYIPDPKVNRPTKLEAEVALKVYYSKNKIRN